MIKKGDTLIEVTLAVGIFSMIAIAIASVMSGGTSSAQTALETTLAREAIDEQAEALRFIQASYIADKDNVDQKYAKLWDEIINSNVLSSETTEAATRVLQFSPKTCSELYNNSENNIRSQRAFVINPRNLGTFSEKEVKDVFISINSTDNSAPSFNETLTYPRLVYGRDNKNKKGDLVDENETEVLSSVEGIYVIAVADQGTTSLAGQNEGTAAFYDFYIRTCWYGSNANEPSTISTVIRLYNPQAVESTKKDDNN